MSTWIWPTTADIGMRVFANNFSSLLGEVAQGVQAYLMSEQSARHINKHVRNTGEWRVRSEHNSMERSFLFLAWIEEILYRAEVHGQWYVDGSVMVDEDEDGWFAVAQVSWVDDADVEREIEIKAVTTHELVVKEVPAGEFVASKWPDVPDFEGPGWYADVVFDI